MKLIKGGREREGEGERLRERERERERERKGGLLLKAFPETQRQMLHLLFREITATFSHSDSTAGGRDFPVCYWPVGLRERETTLSSSWWSAWAHTRHTRHSCRREDTRHAEGLGFLCVFTDILHPLAIWHLASYSPSFLTLQPSSPITS